MTTAALQVVDLHVRTAHVQIFKGICLHAMPGEIVALLGRDGAGQPASLRTMLDQTYAREGSVRIVGKDVLHADSRALLQLGLHALPYDCNLFSSLTCEENLLLPPGEGDTPGGALSLSQIYAVCPQLQPLRNTLAERLTHAQRRLLAIARTLRSGVNVLLLDDIANGMNPVTTRTLASLVRQLGQMGYAVVMAEQTMRFCESLADRFYVMDHGIIVDSFDSTTLAGRRQDIHSMLYPLTGA